jgi:hypothetical protein
VGFEGGAVATASPAQEFAIRQLADHLLRFLKPIVKNRDNYIPDFFMLLWINIFYG